MQSEKAIVEGGNWADVDFTPHSVSRYMQRVKNKKELDTPEKILFRMWESLKNATKMSDAELRELRKHLSPKFKRKTTKHSSQYLYLANRKKKHRLVFVLKSEGGGKYACITTLPYHDPVSRKNGTRSTH